MSEYRPPYQLTEKILGLCMDISREIQQARSIERNADRPKLHRANRIRSVHSSLAIEHNSLSLDEVTAVLDGKRVVAPRQEVLEVENAFRAYDLLGALDPFSIKDLLRAHGVMMEGLAAEAGCFRSEGVGVFAGEKLIHAGTPARYVPEVMEQLFGWLKRRTVHPLVQSCVFHYEFEFIHPFSDGNGRTGRFWQTLILSRWEPVFSDLPIESMILDHQQAYYDMLNTANAQGDCTVFVEFMLEMILDAARKTFRDGTPCERTPEETLLAILEKEPDLTIVDMAYMMRMSDRQVRRLLTSLRAKGKLRREGSNKKGLWIVIKSEPLMS